MADSPKPDISVIESAMSRLAAGPPDADPKLERRSLGRRDYDLALAQRLKQLESAMGEDFPATKPAPPAPSAAPANQPDRTFSASTLALASLLSALAGAGLMWLATGDDKPKPLPQTKPIGIAPSAVTQQPVETPVAAPQAPARSAEELVRERLENWRLAWISRDSEAYLSHYSPDFVPADGQGRADWAAARRKNLASRSDISVQVRELQIERIDDNRMKASFLQDYASGSYREKAQDKTLLFVRYGSDWLIVGEWQGVAPKLGPPN